MKEMTRTAIEVEYDVDQVRQKVAEETGFYFGDTYMELEDKYGHDLEIKAEFASEEDYKIILNEIEMIMKSYVIAIDEEEEKTNEQK